MATCCISALTTNAARLAQAWALGMWRPCNSQKNFRRAWSRRAAAHLIVEDTALPSCSMGREDAVGDRDAPQAAHRTTHEHSLANLSTMLDVGGGVMPLAGFSRDALGGAGEPRLSRLSASPAGAAAANGPCNAQGRAATDLRPGAVRGARGVAARRSGAGRRDARRRRPLFRVRTARPQTARAGAGARRLEPRRAARDRTPPASRGHRRFLRRARFRAFMARRRGLAPVRALRRASAARSRRGRSRHIRLQNPGHGGGRASSLGRIRAQRSGRGLCRAGVRFPCRSDGGFRI